MIPHRVVRMVKEENTSVKSLHRLSSCYYLGAVDGSGVVSRIISLYMTSVLFWTFS